ncbi:cyclin-dependent kinase inhibitor 1D [Takifugu rubripes]|uniref:Cyclin-dependent kinase inhibitor 1B-like n=1 Tax=Takifugu rubripes TaxID=31033 RepID=A0A3B5K970_TAKRU|nr:cyclin-dependent kinase inhibitor 1B-like [Takifugu rubripes]|eukprot:XP_003972984.1 PREDICTED: cyclin-dependent kinase inhibitor 1B-like [Takifugu rubripes]
MAMVSIPTAEPAMAREISRLGGVEALNMKVGPVRRNLFGPVDHDQLQQDFERLLRMSVEVANKRWDFDFQNEKPGRGAGVEWEELSCQDVPAFYRSCLVRAAPLPPSKRRTSSSSSSPYSSSGESSPGSSSSPGTSDQYLDVTRKGCYRVRRQRKRRQPAITEFFRVKKRKLLYYKESSRQ